MHLSPREFVELSGLSLATVHRRLADGSIPKIQFGGKRCRILIPRSALNSTITANQPATAKPAAAERASRVRSGMRPRWTKNSTQSKE